jgi:hypothetical protein
VTLRKVVASKEVVVKLPAVRWLAEFINSGLIDTAKGHVY